MTDQILQKMKTAEQLRFQDPELAEVFARSALEDAQALGCVSASLHFLLADLLDDQGKDLQGFTEVTEALRLDPFHPRARDLADTIAKRLRFSLRSALRSADDPATEAWSSAPDLLAPRARQTAFLDATGEVARSDGFHDRTGQAVAQV